MTPRDRRDAWMLFAAAALSSKVDAMKNDPANGAASMGDERAGMTFAMHAARDAGFYADAMLFELEKRRGLSALPESPDGD